MDGLVTVFEGGAEFFGQGMDIVGFAGDLLQGNGAEGFGSKLGLVDIDAHACDGEEPGGQFVPGRKKL